jgi:DNA replication protein DnaC
LDEDYHALVNRLEEAQKLYRLERLLTQLDKTALLIIDELGYAWAPSSSFKCSRIATSARVCC